MFAVVKVCLLMSLLTISSNIFSFSQPSNLHPGELFSSSHIIAFLKLREGAILFSTENRVEFSVEKILKGKLESKQLKISYGHLSYPERPDTLGATYAIFLEKDDGDIVINKSGYSVVRISKIVKDRGDINLVLERLGLNHSDLREYDENFVFYPVVCSYSKRRLCDIALDTIDAIENKQNAHDL